MNRSSGVHLLILGGWLVGACGGGFPVDPSGSPAQSSGAVVDARLGESFELRVGQEARIRAESLTILFRSVPEDSRCPEVEDLNCVWEGNARVHIEIAQRAHARRTIELNTTVEPKRGSYLDYEIQLVSVRPGTQPSAPIPPESYVVGLLVTPAPDP